MYVVINRCTIVARQDGIDKDKTAQCHILVSRIDGYLRPEVPQKCSDISIGLENLSHPSIATRASIDAPRIANDDHTSESRLCVIQMYSLSTLSGIQILRHAE
jgi:hypothetical protein